MIKAMFGRRDQWSGGGSGGRMKDEGYGGCLVGGMNVGRALITNKIIITFRYYILFFFISIQPNNLMD